jgi:hypothetical protein
MKYAKVGELYHDLIEQFKIKLAIDEGVLDDEVKGLLGEAKEEILSLKSQVNKLTGEKMTVEEDAKQMAAHIYLRKKCDGLVESQREYILNLLGDITDAKEIDRKFEYAVKMSESFEPGAEVPVEDGEAFNNACVCPQCGAIGSSQAECSATPCGVCGAMMKDVEDDPIPAEEQGQGAMEVPADLPEPTDGLAESTGPFSDMKNKWLKILKENRF